MAQATREDDVIHIRASAETKALLNRAAALWGQKLSEFMLDSARRQAEEAILDQRVFFLDPQAHEAFLTALDAPPAANPRWKHSFPVFPLGVLKAWRRRNLEFGHPRG